MVPSHTRDPAPMRSNFAKRTLSAAIGGPLAVGAIMLGSPYVDVLTLFLTGILLWEWSNLSGLPLSHPVNSAVMLFLGFIVSGSSNFLSLCIIFSGSLGLIAFYHYKVGAKLLPSFLLLSGPLYIAAGMATILALAKSEPLLLLWGLLVVWTTDTGAYVAGNLIGGPKLVPRISPGKTWAGLAGGTMAGSAMAVTMALYCQLHYRSEATLLALAILTTFVAHGGDILESAAKRLFKAKDSGHLIPGHGGLLDRMDSLLLVALFLKALQFFKGL